MNFHLLRLQPEGVALATWASRHGLVSPDGDFGYALHALLTAAFGDLAPKPFSYLGETQGLLAYTSESIESLRLNAALATPDVARALGLHALDARPFPTVWRTGHRLDFELRVRPIIRSKEGRERDAFLHKIDSMADSEGPADRASHSVREEVYKHWLQTQLAINQAAEVVDSQMKSFKLVRVMRKVRIVENGQRKSVNVAGPDAVFNGQLIVGDSDAFQRLLVRGVGRHRTFGFGMLLLRPASAC